ncbi:uncharacterized protein PHALS_01246 [Plasmopara halstedii]|uniref:Uncharacterized protein n=1 Tax=Plasmopara halstedii TaxID=4781 RepID=A0A0P1AVE2_PLAHL|nr:uncharacterized protein PHALS_01246 [Plasmopara halstedii]CEG44921.1 hypothetical protein PHALS_01246 [Plasmopara halstedii]|eukprot:XP_024581290.1 hypothetical protein PHALS_01246 [Plasmopara halstedii]
MTDNMRKKSVIQMTFLMALLTASMTLQIIMDVPIIISNPTESWRTLSFEGFCIIKYYIPGLLLSVAFLYIMRRVEQRESKRMVVIANQSIIEFVECSSPGCVWCAHHRRYHSDRMKWDITLMSSFSPRTIDSSYHSSTQANLSQNSWSSRSLHGVPPSRQSRDSLYYLHKAYQAHHIPYQAYQARENSSFSFPTHGDYEHPLDISVSNRALHC